MFLSRIEKQVNRFLNMDEDAMLRIAALDGKVLHIDLLNTRAEFYLCLSRHGVHMVDNYPGKADVSIAGTPTDLLLYVGAGSDQGSLAGVEITLTGDVALGQEFQQILRNLDLDWEEQLSRRVGDTAAHQLGRMVRGAAGFLRNAGDKLQLDTSEYLRFEKDMSVDAMEIDEFTADVDTLRDDVERLKKRIDRIAAETQAREPEC